MAAHNIPTDFQNRPHTVIRITSAFNIWRFKVGPQPKTDPVPGSLTICHCGIREYPMFSRSLGDIPAPSISGQVTGNNYLSAHPHSPPGPAPSYHPPALPLHLLPPSLSLFLLPPSLSPPPPSLTLLLPFPPSPDLHHSPCLPRPQAHVSYRKTIWY